MTNTLKIGIAGLGTVGAGVVSLLAQNKALIAERTGKEIVLTAVSARDKQKKRDCDLTRIEWVDDAKQLAARADVDVVIELMGGAEGDAKALVEAAIVNGKHVVTANKALIAHHGTALAKLAEKHNVQLAFEAAVAGGIPIIKALREGLAANRFTRVAGILNGTCNYILTTMEKSGRDFADVLAEAQAKGYAEADPSFDIDGVDTAHKLSIITSLAYGTPVDIAGVYVEGIRGITSRDIQFAKELGYRLKLLGLATLTDAGVMQRVHPCLVPIDAPIAQVDGSFNGVVVEGNGIDRMMFEGRGAGALPTASAVLADVMDLARGLRYHPFALPVSKLVRGKQATIDTLKSCYYIRLVVIDRPGVLADVTAIFKDEGISMRSLLQHSHSPGEPVQVVIDTHETLESSLQRAVGRIGKLPSMHEAPHMIRIETL